MTSLKQIYNKDINERYLRKKLILNSKKYSKDILFTFYDIKM